MTTQTEKPKAKIAYYVFVANEEGETLRVGTAFPHQKGKGLNILIDGTRFIAFPPKAKREVEEESA